MFLDLVDPTGFDKDKLLKFCLTVSKNYRPIPYHNWEHAFSVAHCMYYVLKGVPQMFTEMEVRSTLSHLSLKGLYHFPLPCVSYKMFFVVEIIDCCTFASGI